MATFSVTGTAQELAEILADHVHPFQEKEELKNLATYIEGERLVLMGEASHGTSEFYTKRARLSKILIEKQGFNFIAVEGDWASFARINEFVKHKPGAAASSGEAMEAIGRWPLWMWRNREVKELVEWLHDYNRNLEPEERVGIYGIDVYDHESAMDDVVSWVTRMDADLGQQAGRAYSCMTRHPGAGEYVSMVAQTGQNCSEDLGQVLDIVRSLEQHPDAKPWDYFRAEQAAKVAINAERHYRANLEQSTASWNYRASHFYLTAERLLEFYGEGSRGIIWAHNTHIGDARATDMGQIGMQNIGQLSRESLGRDQVFAIGFGTYRGRVLAAFHWEGEMQSMSLPEAVPRSWEYFLEQTGHEKIFLTFRDEQLAASLDRRIPHRAVGVTYNPANEQNNYVPTLLPERYDAFVFIKNTDILNVLD